MLKSFKRFLTGALLTAGLVSSSGLANAQDYLRTFTLINRSSFTIRSLYVSPTDDSRWGYDRLGSLVLVPNFEATVRLYPGYYDLKLVDQDGDSCVVRDVDFTRSDSFVLDNATLLVCELFH